MFDKIEGVTLQINGGTEEQSAYLAEREPYITDDGVLLVGKSGSRKDNNITVHKATTADHAEEATTADTSKAVAVEGGKLNIDSENGTITYRVSPSEDPQNILSTDSAGNPAVTVGSLFGKQGALYGTLSERDAITDPQDGQIFFVIPSN